MTLVATYVRAIGIGLLVAAPVGAMALRCIERTLTRGRLSGLMTGVGIATADALYASIAAFGLTALTGAITGIQAEVRLVGGAFLIYLGVMAMRSRPRECDAQGGSSASLAAAYGSALLLTLANPQTVITFASIFAGSGLAVSGGGWVLPGLVVAGVFTGSLLWWVVLVTLIARLREHAGDRVLLWVTRTSGAALALFGVLTLWSALTA